MLINCPLIFIQWTRSSDYAPSAPFVAWQNRSKPFR